MDAWTESGSRSACEDARRRASLALDGSLLGDLGLRTLRSHLDACPACARFVARMGLATSLLRSAPLETFRCAPKGRRPGRLRPAPGGLPWVAAAIAVAALVVGGGSLPRGTEAPGPPGQAVGRDRLALAPLKLPIGQRSAVDDFETRAAVVDPLG